jgi:hypothetical protein
LGTDFNSGPFKRQFIVGESLRLELDEQLLYWFLCEEEEELRRGEEETPKKLD